MTELTWRDLCKIEPKLEAILEDICALTDDHTRPSFCANALWYGQLVDPPKKSRSFKLTPVRLGDPTKIPRRKPSDLPRSTGFKYRMAVLVGYYAENRAIRTTEAYGLAYDNLYGALPPCRNCSCG